MKILFQGGWKQGRDPVESAELVKTYCTVFAEFVISHNHQVILTSNRDYDKLIAETIEKLARQQGKAVKEHLMFLLSDRITEVPNIGIVRRIEQSKWWIEERTYAIQNTDVIVAIGGGKGTFDCLEKALLASKPVFVATKIQSGAANAWKRRRSHYKHLTEGDTDYMYDLNITPEEFFEQTFKLIDALEELRYTRNIFIIHGHDHHFKDSLVTLLNILEFNPIVLQDEPNKSLTIIEKLERDTDEVGFSFVLYTPDDIGSLKGESERNRARQNVVFEHGLLIGLLGRERTCAIVKGDLEIPSDINGMLFESINDIRQESLAIARVLRAAGYKVDASKLL